MKRILLLLAILLPLFASSQTTIIKKLGKDVPVVYLEGTLAPMDAVLTDIKQFPEGTFLINKTSNKVFIRETVTKLAADYVEYSEGSGGGGSTTLQQAITNGSELTEAVFINNPNSDGTESTVISVGTPDFTAAESEVSVNTFGAYMYSQGAITSENSQVISTYNGSGLESYNASNSITFTVRPDKVEIVKDGTFTTQLPVYKVYTALLTQTGTDAPVATVLENTLGGTVVWTRDSEGYYIGTLVGGFPDGRTVILPLRANSIADNNAIYRLDEDSIGIETAISGVVADGSLNESTVIVYVYPAP